MKRTREITIIHYRRRRVRKRRTGMAEACLVCGSPEMITAAAAVRLTGISRSTLDRWIASQQVHAVRSNTRQLLICRRSLFARADQGILKSLESGQIRCEQRKLE